MGRRHSTVVVVGGGGMGLATAWRLAKRGTDVRVLEQFPLFHHRGSSHSEHRITIPRCRPLSASAGS